MIRAINSIQTQSKYTRYKLIRDTGYIAVGTGILCGITGSKTIKFPAKMKLHKYSAYIAILSSLTHLGAIKRWDKKILS